MYFFRLFSLSSFTLILMMCMPPADSGKDPAANKKRLDSLRTVKCPRLMSSATEAYNSSNWQVAVNRYKEANKFNCSEWNTGYFDNLYQYYAISYERMSKYDSSEAVCLDGLNIRPDDKNLRIRLAYAYKKQGKVEKEIIEYVRLTNKYPKDFSFLKKLSELYRDDEKYDDQISVLERMLKLKPEDEAIRGDLATAYKNSGKDPLDLYREQWNENKENPSYGQQLAEALHDVAEYDEAISVLNEVIELDPSNKIAYRKLADANKAVDNLNAAAIAYEELFKTDPRDYRIAIEISKTYLKNVDYRKALKWADKSIDLNKKSGEGYAQKGWVLFDAWIDLNSSNTKKDDKIVAKLAYDYFKKAEEKGYLGETKTQYLLDNKSDFLYGRGDWHMESETVKNTKQAKTTTKSYDWVSEPLKADPSW